MNLSMLKNFTFKYIVSKDKILEVGQNERR